MPRQTPRERLYADLPEPVMRKLDAMATYFSLTRTSMLIMCIHDRYTLLPNGKQREIAKQGGLPMPAKMPDSEYKSDVDEAEIEALAEPDTEDEPFGMAGDTPAHIRKLWNDTNGG